MRTAVVLPAPFGPSTPSTVPRGTDRSIPRSACTSPNDLTRPSTRIAGPELICDTPFLPIDIRSHRTYRRPLTAANQLSAQAGRAMPAFRLAPAVSKRPTVYDPAVPQLIAADDAIGTSRYISVCSRNKTYRELRVVTAGTPTAVREPSGSSRRTPSRAP